MTLTDEIQTPTTIPIHGGNNAHTGNDDLYEAARRYGEAAASADACRKAVVEADEALVIADCDAIDAINDDWEANLGTGATGGNSIGFATELIRSESMDLTASSLAAEQAKLSYQRRRGSAMRAEVLAGRAQREVEAAEQRLLEVSRALTTGSTVTTLPSMESIGGESNRPN